MFFFRSTMKIVDLFFYLLYNTSRIIKCGVKEVFEVQSTGTREQLIFWEAAEMLAQNLSKRFGEAVITSPERATIIFRDGNICHQEVEA